MVRAALCETTGTEVPPAGIDPSFEPIVIWALLDEIYEDYLTRADMVRRRDQAIAEIIRRGATKAEIARMFGISPRKVGQVLVEVEHDIEKLTRP